MARRNSQNAISLFPFLAVLVCTMGALILLLLVTTRRIRHEQISVARESAVAAPQPQDWPQAIDSSAQAPEWAGDDVPQWNGDAVDSNPPPPRKAAAESDSGDVASITLLPPDPSADERQQQKQKRQQWQRQQRQAKEAEAAALQVRIDQESEQRDLLRQHIAAARAELQQAEQNSDGDQAGLQQLAELRQQEQELSLQLDQKNRLLAKLQQELEIESRTTEQGEQLLRTRESALISLRQMAELKSEPSAAGSDTTIIEFTNSTGTQRSPVIIDVTADGFQFLPAGVKLSEADMEGFPANDNPLLSGIMSVHDARHSQSLSVKPYVLLLVRPNGSMMFYVAQRTLTDAGIHFGYELVEQSRHIAAGSVAAGERSALQNAVQAAFRRRAELYSEMVAQVESVRPGTPNAARNALPQPSARRRVQVLPDGRVVFAEDDPPVLDGRYYAGGEAPPPRERRALIPHSDRATDPDRRDQETIAESDPNPWGFREPGDTREQTSAADGEEATFPPLVSADVTSPPGSAAAPEIIPGPSRSTDDTSAAPDLAALFPDANGMPQSVVNNGTADMKNSGTGDGSSGAEGAFEVTQLDAVTLFPRRDVLSGNMGVQGPGSFSTPAHNQGSGDGSTENQSIDASGSQAAMMDRPTHKAPTTSLDGMAQAWPDSNRTSSQMRSGWSDQAAAAPGLTTRTAGTPENSSTRENPSVFGSVGTTAGPEQGSSGRGGSPTDSESFLRRFMQAVEEQKETKQPDSFLLAMLQQAKNQSSDSDTSGASDSEASTEAGSHKPPDSVPASRTVMVVLERDQLTIGDFEAIDIQGWEQDQILAMIIKGLNADADIRTASQAGQDDTAPSVVEFAVAEEMQSVQQQLSARLKQMDVNTSRVRVLKAADGAVSPSPNPASSGSSETAPAPLQEPAVPSNPTPPPERSRGRSV
ncbi:MAG: hypothetical protein RIK87_01220 [Fuerstiella sp.]